MQGLELLRRVLEVRRLVVREREVVADAPVPWRHPEGAAVRLDRLLVPAERRERRAQVRARLGRGPEAQALAVGRDRALEVAGLVQGDGAGEHGARLLGRRRRGEDRHAQQGHGEEREGRRKHSGPFPQAGLGLLAAPGVPEGGGDHEPVERAADQGPGERPAGHRIPDAAGFRVSKPVGLGGEGERAAFGRAPERPHRHGVGCKEDDDGLPVDLVVRDPPLGEPSQQVGAGVAPTFDPGHEVLVDHGAAASQRDPRHRLLGEPPARGESGVRVHRGAGVKRDATCPMS